MTIIQIDKTDELIESFSNDNEIKKEQVTKSWDELTKEEKSDIIKKMSSEVKVKFTSGEIIGFNPFRICASFPAKYQIKNYTLNNKYEFIFEHNLHSKISNYGVETNNIEYLKEAKFKVNNILLNVEL